MIPDSRRLKRGLKDISPLFDQESKEENKQIYVPSKMSKPLKTLSVYDPRHGFSSLPLNTFFASFLKTLGHESVVVTLREDHKSLSGVGGPSDVKRFIINHQQFQTICRSDSGKGENLSGSVLFFDFNPMNPVHFKTVLPVLDQWIFSLTPDFESLAEAYKVMKAAIPVNPNLEYFVMYEGPQNESKEALLFERFSELVSRRLGVGINWLGQFDIRQPGHTQRLDWEALELLSIADSLEKRAFAGLIFPSEKS